MPRNQVPSPIPLQKARPSPKRLQSDRSRSLPIMEHMGSEVRTYITRTVLAVQATVQGAQTHRMHISRLRAPTLSLNQQCLTHPRYSIRSSDQLLHTPACPAFMSRRPILPVSLCHRTHNRRRLPLPTPTSTILRRLRILATRRASAWVTTWARHRLGANGQVTWQRTLAICSISISSQNISTPRRRQCRSGSGVARATMWMRTLQRILVPWMEQRRIPGRS